MKGILFDFDNTLTHLHVYSEYCKQGDTFIQSVNEDFIKNLLSIGVSVKFSDFLKVCRKKEIICGIGSYGSLTAINRVNDVCFHSQIKHIYTPGQFPNFWDGQSMNDGKKTIIKAFAKDIGCSSNEIMLIDDDPSNISPIPAPFSITYRGRGLTVGQMNQLIDSIENSHL